jgi:phage terminase Nu1 subunit (DNA packaging protein)
MATQAEVAEKLGISDRWLRKLIDDGVITAAKRGEYEFDAVARDYIAHLSASNDRLKQQVGTLQAELDRLKDSPQLVDKQVHETRRSKALADKAEMDAAEMRGLLVPADQIADVLHTAVLIMKTRVRGVPTKVAPQVGARDIALAERVIRVAIDEALEELSKVNVIRGGPAAAA